MNTAKKLSGIALATAAAGLFAATLATPVLAAKHEGMVHCLGINGCKGKSDCATADNACKGHNACNGKGWVATSAKDCTKKGGKVEEKKAE